jgi:hypothetical protein
MRISDDQGHNAKLVTQFISPAEAAAQSRARLNRWYAALSREDLSWLSAAQTKAFKERKMNEGGLSMILYIIEATKYAGEIGGDLVGKMEEVKKAYAVHGDVITGSHSSVADAVFNAYSGPGITQDQWDEMQFRNTRRGRDLDQINFMWDRNPVWSPDAKKIAFIRLHDDMYGERESELMVLDVNSAKSVSLFTANGISNVSWSTDGKELVLQSNRYLFSKPRGTSGDSVVMSSYPEIWILEPR